MHRRTRVTLFYQSLWNIRQSRSNKICTLFNFPVAYVCIHYAFAAECDMMCAASIIFEKYYIQRYLYTFVSYAAGVLVYNT